MLMFAVVSGYSFWCERYVVNSIGQAEELLSQAVESRTMGDYDTSREYVDLAWNEWKNLTKKSGYILADLTIAADVTIAISRARSVSRTDDSERFIEESAVAILMLEHFLADNRNFMDGSLHHS